MANYKGASGGFHDEAREAGSPLMGEALATLRRQISKKFERWDGRLDDFNGQTTRNNIVGDQHSVDQMLRTPDGPRHRRVPALERHAMPRYEPHAYAEEFGGGYDGDMQFYRGYNRRSAYEQERRDYGRRNYDLNQKVYIPSLKGDKVTEKKSTVTTKTKEERVGIQGQILKESDVTRCRQFLETRCAIQGKVFNVTVDSGSYQNLINRKVVKKMGLEVESHQTACIIERIKTVQVIERCRVTFNIGSYQDSVWFDVVDMSMGGLLFGRPWHYDVAAQYDSAKNIYKIKKDGVRYALYPKMDGPSSKGTRKEDKSLFITAQSREQMETSMKDSKKVHDVVIEQCMEENKVDKENIAPDEVKPLLSNFQDVMFDTLQEESPPMCVIPCRIDLYPGANSSNLIHDRRNPKEVEVSKNTIEESVEVELIQESPSPCAVLSLVTSTKGGIWRRRKKTYMEGNRVMKHLKMVQFLAGVYNKIKPKKYSVCRIVRKFNGNTYEANLPATKTISQIFDVSNVCPFLFTDVPSSPDEPQSSRSSFFKERENDGGTSNNIRTRGRGNTRGHKGSVRRRKMGRKLDQTRWGTHGWALGRGISAPRRIGARDGAHHNPAGAFQEVSIFRADFEKLPNLGILDMG